MSSANTINARVILSIVDHTKDCLLSITLDLGQQKEQTKSGT